MNEQLTNEYKKQIAETIISQMGGGRIKAMVGSSQFSYSSEIYDGYEQPYVMFDFKMNRKMKYCKVIYLQVPDVYVMQFINNKGVIVKEIKDVYCDDLIHNFEQTTGLYLYL